MTRDWMEDIEHSRMAHNWRDIEQRICGALSAAHTPWSSAGIAVRGTYVGRVPRLPHADYLVLNVAVRDRFYARKAIADELGPDFAVRYYVHPYAEQHTIFVFRVGTEWPDWHFQRGP
jgi:hypothetical protein